MKIVLTKGDISRAQSGARGDIGKPGRRAPAPIAQYAVGQHVTLTHERGLVRQKRVAGNWIIKAAMLDRETHSYRYYLHRIANDGTEAPHDHTEARGINIIWLSEDDLDRYLTHSRDVSDRLASIVHDMFDGVIIDPNWEPTPEESTTERRFAEILIDDLVENRDLITPPSIPTFGSVERFRQLDLE